MSKLFIRQEKKTIGLLIIATNKYKSFVVDFFKSVDKHFFKDECITIYLFTDERAYFDDLFKDLSPRINIQMFDCLPYKFPEATLLRYMLFLCDEQHIKSDYLFYSDVDMRFVGDVAHEILPTDEEGITAIVHPAFFNGGWGSHGTHKLSKSYVAPENQKKYYCGGFQGGTREAYLKLAATCNENIIADFKTAIDIGYTENNGILTEYHDESTFNAYLNSLSHFKVLSPEYCMVEQVHLREQWGISHLKPRLIALEKKHAEIRA